MKSYLSLIPISAKVHKRQNRMTLLCIIFAVFLVTAVFSMADMGIRMEQQRLLEKHDGLNMQDITDSAMGQSLYLSAGVLFVLILIAGVLMISSSINSNVAQRTKFFGMMRCIGMSKQQIVRFVRLEALNWCKTAVPIGLGLGIVTTWGLCAVLRFLVGEEFSHIPLFGISVIGIISGIVIGIVTVLIAARSPAKRAARVSPASAVSGNAEITSGVHHGVRKNMFKIDTALGVRHALSTKKNLILMTGSFALSIILFLSFSVLIDFVNYLMPQYSNTYDISIAGRRSEPIDQGLLNTIGGMDGVKRVFGRKSAFDVKAELNEKKVQPIDIISYDKFDLDCLTEDDMLKKGSDISKVYGDSNYVLATWDQNSPLKIGDKMRVGTKDVEIAGLLKYDPFNSDGSTRGKNTLITSGKTFERLTGRTNYSLVMIQLSKDASEKDVQAIRQRTDGRYTFKDQREQNTSGTYMAFVFCIYGFLAIITLVTILNIVNSISMSVSARIKQYGAMRAVGMDARQITKMIAAEAFTYALSGCIVGCIIGLWISKAIYYFLITSHFHFAAWSLPAGDLAIILLFVLAAAIAAVYAPSKRIRNMAVTETINEL